ncbi:hypothetical protein PC116_g16585 [Phytophthora cactorum]|uniref:Uncharacterized protein n=1 Tax=Phytophthora cactorum TaxID=29920 RepID=A0A8T1D791_9STRA|nr:hypothetical protein PC114_g8453 [Phytophthora cactorum]KAG2936457.1 hypothetical protein PC117_g12107 [Phytophthora cactorum]KAG3025706.1 hypothetical protein PC119_g8088 [Phytophthora cactorum]KAG3163173.1 hypothetical protein C6341_g13035 [Phytophthora cactorum]KAG4235274.1 hypothetical protein PC116_g16585 [Phytophthora cactorum]
MALTIYAGEAAGREVPPPFTASDHSVSNCTRRFEISLRRWTNLTIINDAALVERAARCMPFLRDLQPTIDREQTVLMDETAVYFEDARQTTLDFNGARHVVVRSTGFASMRITVVLR